MGHHLKLMDGIVLAQGIWIEKKIKAVKSWLEPKLVKDIQGYLGFANFYRRFIKNFSRIAMTFTLIL